MLKSLIYYWRSHLAVLLGAAVASAVLTGALLVGDSVRGSLRALALDRLGKIDEAVVAEHLFREQLAEDLTVVPGFRTAYESVAPALILNGSAVHAESRSRSSGINIYGIDDRFTSFFGESLTFEKQPGQLFPSLIINESLRRDLGAAQGDQVLLSFQRLTDVHPESLLGDRDADKVVERIRLTISSVVPDQGIGRFGMRPNQNMPLNAFISLSLLQERLGQEGRANALFLTRDNDRPLQPDASGKPLEELAGFLQQAHHLDDYGIALLPREGYLSLESREFVISRSLATAAIDAATELELEKQPILTYLANAIEVAGRSIPYSTMTAMDAGSTDSASVSPFGRWIHMNWRQTLPLGDDEIYLNEWAARALNPQLGSLVRVSYYVVEAGEELRTETAEFQFKGVVRIHELGADTHLTADYPGIADADNMSDWDPPFPVDLGLIAPADEEYWDRYRGTPKAFVNLTTGQRLWSSRFGNLTAIRLALPRTDDAPPTDSSEDPGLQQLAVRFSEHFLKKLKPVNFGFSFQPLKERGLRAAEGATDFGQLFIGFSFFLIISSALLVGLLFRLGAEQRAKEIGILLSIGFPAGKVLRRFLIEGGLLAVLGSALGLFGAIIYAWLMMAGLRTLWVSAVGSPFLYLHVGETSLYVGFGASALVVLLSLWQAVRRMSKVPAPLLLSGVSSVQRSKGPSLKAKWTAHGALLLSIGLLLGGFFVEGPAAAGVFFGVGSCLLISGLGYFAVWCRSPRASRVIGSEGSDKTLLPIAARNTSRNPGRSLLSTALVASASFIIIAVGSFHQEFGEEVFRKESGAGGFSLLAQSDIPIHHDLNTREARLNLGLSDEELSRLDSVQVFQFRRLPGEDASCLNLYKPEKPTILGVPTSLVSRGGFGLARTGDGRENPWTLLDDELEDGVIPAFADANSSQWILKVPLGGEIVSKNDAGQDIRLRIVGLIPTSIFQSEILISEQRFLENFPSRDGRSYFLFETPQTGIDEISLALERGLADYGFDMTTTAEKLADYHAVQNTYLSTFQTLGGLGLLLGTLGLGIIVTRNVLERRSELATLRAFGFQRSHLARIVLAENTFLLSLGVGLGTVAALLAVIPQIITQGTDLPWVGLLLTLAVIFAVGILSSARAVRAALRIPLLPALKEER